MPSRDIELVRLQDESESASDGIVSDEDADQYFSRAADRARLVGTPSKARKGYAQLAQVSPRGAQPSRVRPAPQRQRGSYSQIDPEESGVVMATQERRLSPEERKQKTKARRLLLKQVWFYISLVRKRWD
jgi:hypothetical protein